MQVKNLRLIFWDQLHPTISSLKNINKKDDLVLLIESYELATEVKHHKKKLILLFSAMRHFAAELKKQNFHVDYVSLTDESKKTSFNQIVLEKIKQYQVEKLILTEPSEWNYLERIKKLQKLTKIPFEILEDERFFCSISEFKQYAKNKKQLRMEFFYREMRKKTNYLMKNNQPIGAQWNFDVENRKRYDGKITIPNLPGIKPDKITKEVITLVEHHFSEHFGDATPFWFAVTRDGAEQLLKNFLEHCLQYFGNYQDAMLDNHYYLFHAVLSMYINCGLLLAKDVCEQALNVYHHKKIPLPSIEGFIRQIIGWREYIRGVYWLKMPSYRDNNYLNADRPLPDFYWTADTKLNCLKQTITATQKNAYAHHIQRLMVTGNFALLCGLDVNEVNEWYWIVYADAYEWVELPNTSGMTLFADGGFLASKPYAASGQYIHKMSNYCESCHYNVNEKLGETACPFNYLYWYFLIRNEKRLKNNQRLRIAYTALAKFDPKKRKQICDDAEKFLNSLKSSY